MTTQRLQLRTMLHHKPTPTSVAIYELVGTRYQRVAQFRLTGTAAVELTLTRPDGCPMARRWLREGIRIPGVAEPATIHDGPAFMRALLAPRRLSYCRIVDETPGPAVSGAPAGPGRTGDERR
ncbi:hypothetical protein [Nocardia carnea]|uniref:hypothetical protein n=1 Tax=Nocardia carnea TaxID=37328 RepID=UPI002457A235|nr:hypothetical protein [Nocardia carnea]